MSVPARDPHDRVPARSLLAKRSVRWPVALVAGALLVAAMALLMEAFIEANTDLVWTIHWFETVPFIVLLFAYALNRVLADQADAESRR